MNKKTIRLISALLILSSMTACANNNVSETETEADIATQGYDWGTLSDETEAAEEKINYSYTFDNTAISSALRSEMTEDDYKAYCEVVNAIYTHSTGVIMNISSVNTILKAVSECYLPSCLVSGYCFIPDQTEAETEFEETSDATDTTEAEQTEEISETEPIDEEAEQTAVEEELPLTGTLEISYLYDSDEHNSKLAQFYQGAANILGEPGVENLSEFGKAVIIYRWVAQNIEDFTSVRTPALEAIINEGMSETSADCYTIKGSSHNICYAYLLRQAGVGCTTSLVKYGSETRMITAVNIGGVCYYCDPSFESTDTSGNGLRYFGMNDSDLAAYFYAGTPYISMKENAVPYIISCDTELYVSDDYIVLNTDNEKFSSFRSCDVCGVKDGVLTVFNSITGESTAWSLTE